MKVAICYDRISKFGGAERVLLALKELYPDADLFTLTYDERGAEWARGWTIKSSFLQKIPVLGKKHEIFPPIAGFAWEQFNFNGHDVVISVTSEAAKGIITAPETLHICYCLTPTRYLWSGFYDYLAQPGFGVFSSIAKFFLILFATPLRVWDWIAGQRPDLMVGISQEVCKRITKYYQRESSLIYPPVEVPTSDKAERVEGTRDYFLVVSRLVPYKRVDLVVEAFNQLGLPLKIVGTGSELDRLKGMGKENIEFLGFVEDEHVGAYYRNCLAVIFPTHEDFGIVPVEAQAYGRPVVAYQGGGALETVVAGKTGVFFEEQTAESLVGLFMNIMGDETDFGNVKAYFERFRSEDCRRNADRFSKEKFLEQFIALIEEKRTL